MLRKNSEVRANIQIFVPQGLKPALFFQILTARLKSCPDAKSRPQEFFSSLRSPYSSISMVCDGAKKGRHNRAACWDACRIGRQPAACSICSASMSKFE
jgi:hypothetical protein